MIDEQKIIVLRYIDELGTLEVLDAKTLSNKEGVDGSLIKTVLHELKSSKFILTTIAGVRITDAGHAHLKRYELDELPKVGPVSVNVGNTTITGTNTFNHSTLLSNSDNNLNEKYITKNIEPIKSKKSLIEIVSWIVGIAVGLVTLYDLLHKYKII